jgi:hypothetical protein
MKGSAVTALVIAAGAAGGEPVDLAGERTVTVCIEGAVPLGMAVAAQAQKIAAEMFAGIDVTIRWRRFSDGCPGKAVRISLSPETPPTLKPGAMAYALPYDGEHIRVFYDRISKAATPSLVPRLLAHVMVHEIAHILQGVDRHSDSGIMKDHWDGPDFQRMAWKALEFEPRDVDLIYRGLARRVGRMIFEDPPAPIATKSQRK